MTLSKPIVLAEDNPRDAELTLRADSASRTASSWPA